MAGEPRIIAGAWRGRKLTTPPGLATRPTAARTRQAAFDILLHAPWAGPAFIQQAKLLDAFAGTGAFGLEFLSRGGAFATFIDNARPAQHAIRANITACHATTQTHLIAADTCQPPPGTPHHLAFLDPPYHQHLIPRALAALAAAHWLTANTIIIAELGPDDSFTPNTLLAERTHGKARLIFGLV